MRKGFYAAILVLGAALYFIALAPSDTGQALVLADQTKTISAQALTSHECNSNEWEFVITQIDKQSDAPTSIHVTWANGQSADVSLTSFTGGVAHYVTTLNLNSTVVSATATIYSGWSGEFNLSHGPCISTATPTVTSTATTTSTPTATGTTTTTATPTGTPSEATNTPTPTATGTLPAETGQIMIIKRICESIGENNSCNGRDTSLAGLMIKFNIFSGTATSGTPIADVAVTLGQNVPGQTNEGAGSQGSALSGPLPLGTYTVCEVPVAHDGRTVPLTPFPKPDGTNQSATGANCITVNLTSGTAVLMFNNLIAVTPTATVTTTATATVTGTPPTATPTVTGTPPTVTPTPTSGEEATATPTVTGTPPTATPTVTGTPATATPTATSTGGGGGGGEEGGGGGTSATATPTNTSVPAGAVVAAAAPPAPPAPPAATPGAAAPGAAPAVTETPVAPTETPQVAGAAPPAPEVAGARAAPPPAAVRALPSAGEADDNQGMISLLLALAGLLTSGAGMVLRGSARAR